MIPLIIISSIYGTTIIGSVAYIFHKTKSKKDLASSRQDINFKS